MSVATKLVSVPVESAGHVQCLRIIRNSGRLGYSNDQHEITAEEQQAWWYRMRDKCHAWLYAANGTVIGFGMIRLGDDGLWNPSAGVLPEHMQRGYGGAIVDSLVDKARGWGLTLYAQALLSNPAALKTHHPDRWDKLGEDETFAYFRSKP